MTIISVQQNLLESICEKVELYTSIFVEFTA